MCKCKCPSESLLTLWTQQEILHRIKTKTLDLRSSVHTWRPDCGSCSTLTWTLSVSWKATSAESPDPNYLHNPFCLWAGLHKNCFFCVMDFQKTCMLYGSGNNPLNIGTWSTIHLQLCTLYIEKFHNHHCLSSADANECLCVWSYKNVPSKPDLHTHEF